MTSDGITRNNPSSCDRPGESVASERRARQLAIAKVESAGRSFARLIRNTDTQTLEYKDPSICAKRAIEKVEEAIMWARRAYLGFDTY